MNQSDSDDEISIVLRHFRPKPTFLSSNHEMPSRQRRHSKVLQRFRRDFTSVKYIANENENQQSTIRLEYLHLHTEENEPIFIFLMFEISLDKHITCTKCTAPSISLGNLIQKHINDLWCKELSMGESLFSIASRLLQLLNDEFPSDLVDGLKLKNDLFDSLVHRIAVSKCIKPNNLHLLIDLQTLLLRCAATSRQRSQVCTPVPIEFSANGRDGDNIAQLVFENTNQLYICGFRGEPSLPNLQQQHPTEEVRALLPFLLSLYWVGESKLQTNKSLNKSNMKISKSKSDTITCKLCLELNLESDPSPTFSAHAKKYGTIQAYHGTKVESAWSILSYGLQNLSFNKDLSQNGAIMGDGVYLSTSFQVAERFAFTAAEHPPPSLALAFQHESFYQLLCFAGVDIVSLGPLDTYDIKCLPVFEATIIHPPREKQCSKLGEDERCFTRQEGKYFVCSDSEFIRITKLHLNFELTKKSDLLQWLTFHLPLTIVVLFLAIYFQVHLK